MEATSNNTQPQSRWDLICSINRTPRPKYKNRLEQIEAAKAKYGYWEIRDMKAVLK